MPYEYEQITVLELLKRIAKKCTEFDYKTETYKDKEFEEWFSAETKTDREAEDRYDYKGDCIWEKDLTNPYIEILLRKYCRSDSSMFDFQVDNWFQSIYINVSPRSFTYHLAIDFRFMFDVECFFGYLRKGMLRDWLHSLCFRSKGK
jgi:hypothetical protein